MERGHSRQFDRAQGLYRWRVEPDAWLLTDAPPSAARTDLRVVALGGGTGLPIVLRGLKELLFPGGAEWAQTPDPHRLTAIVTVADDGGSSGRLRREYDIVAPGDIRDCLLALSDGDPLIARLFDFRFTGNGETAGQCLGNLILTALSQLRKGFDEAVEQGGRILTIRGQVFPSTLAAVTVRAEFKDGPSVEGESRIPLARRRIHRMHLEPPDAMALPQALGALEAADIVVIGPGSLYTSLIPILLIKEIAEGIAGSQARVVLVANLMSEPGETDGYTVADHVEAIRAHATQVQIHDVLLNTAAIAKEFAERHAADGAVPVPTAVEGVEAMGCRVVARDLLARDPRIRHDSSKVARALVDLGPLPERSRNA